VYCVLEVTFQIAGQEINIYDPLRSAARYLQEQIKPRVVDADVEIHENMWLPSNQFDQGTDRRGANKLVQFNLSGVSASKQWQTGKILGQ
jgi:hypothetical protein